MPIDLMLTRCCMCPNLHSRTAVCPHGPFKPRETPCRFVVAFRDERGWLYKVMPGIGSDAFKARYKKPDREGWKCYTKVPWRKSFDEAQADLNRKGFERGWTPISLEDIA